MASRLLRYSPLGACAIGSLLLGAAYPGQPLAMLGSVALAALSAVGVYDLVQTHHSIQRNYPILAHLRFLFETIRPEIRQYFLESNTEAQPFSRNQRSLVYQRAKGQLDKTPFGTQQDVYADGHEWMNHSMSPAKVDHSGFRV